MLTTLMIVHALLSVLLITLVLVQFGKGAEAGLMGGGASDAVMSGAQRGNVLSKATAVIVALFLANSILMSKLQSTKGEDSLLDGESPVRPLSAGAKKAEAQPTANPSAEAAPAAPATTEATTPATTKP